VQKLLFKGLFTLKRLCPKAAQKLSVSHLAQKVQWLSQKVDCK
jgi:hypothetical protein